MCKIIKIWENKIKFDSNAWTNHQCFLLCPYAGLATIIAAIVWMIYIFANKVNSKWKKSIKLLYDQNTNGESNEFDRKV